MPLVQIEPAAQPVVVDADSRGGMDADRGNDGRYRRQGLELKRLQAAQRILRLTDPVHPEQVPTRAFDVTWSRLQKPECPKSDQLASDYGGWDNAKKVCLGQKRPPRPRQLPVVECDRDDAIIALAVVRRHVAVEHDVTDPDEAVVVLSADFDRIRLLLATPPRGRDQEVLVLPSRRQVITALEAIDFNDAMRKAGMTVLPPARPEHAISDAEALLIAVEHHHALPTSGELTAFCKANRISRRSRERPPYEQVIAEARELAADRGLEVPDDYPPLDDRPAWHEPVPALGDGGARRQWNREAVLETLDGFPDWLESSAGPADRKFSHDNLDAYLGAGEGRPDIGTVYEHLGSLEDVTAAVLDRHTARAEDGTVDDPADVVAAADAGPQPALETLLNEHAGPTLPALLRYAQTAGEFGRADLAFLGVSDDYVNRLLAKLVDAEALTVKVRGGSKGWRYRLARPLSERAQRYVDQAPDLDDPLWVLRLAERSKSDRLLAAYTLACEMPPAFTADQYAKHIDKKHAAASKLLRELQALGSVTRRKDTSPKKKGEGAPPWLYEVTERPPHTAVDRRRANR